MKLNFFKISVVAVLSAFHMADMKSTLIDPRYGMHPSKDHLLHFTIFHYLDNMPSKALVKVEALAQ